MNLRVGKYGELSNLISIPGVISYPENLYRYGQRFGRVDLPAWAQERISKIRSERESAAVESIQAGIWQRAVIEKATRALNAAKAAETLGIDLAQPTARLLQHTEALIAQSPERETEFWKAMWDVKRALAAADECLRLSKSYQPAYERVQSRLNRGWPAEWSDSYCDLWQELEGTAESASAWAKSGWGCESVLTNPSARLLSKCVSLKELVICLNTPEFPNSLEEEYV